VKIVLRYFALFAALLCGSAGGAQEKNVAPSVVLVKNATIWTVSARGTLPKADLLVENGKISRVGTDLAAPAGAVVIDASGKHVTPGMIDCHSHSAIRGGVNEGSNNITAEVRIRDVINPEDIAIYRELAGGTTAANLLHGSANSIGGQNAIVKLRWHSTAEEMLIKGAPEGIKFALGENPKRSSGGLNLPGIERRYPNTRMGVNESIRERFTAARDYGKESEEYDKLSAEQKAHREPPRRDLQLEAIWEILAGKRAIHSHSYRQDEILALIRLADEFGIHIGTFQHLLEGYKVADEIAAHGAGASSFSDWWAYKMEAYDAIPYNGAIMQKRGVLVSFNSDSDELARRLNLEDAKAIRWGDLTEEEAIKFNTINPARQLHIDRQTGSLEAGKDADFVIWSGHPLSVYSVAEQTWVDGVKEFDRAEDLASRAAREKERAGLIEKIKASNLPTAGSGGAGRGGAGGFQGQGRGGQAGAPAASTLEPRPKRPIPAPVAAVYLDKLGPGSPSVAIVGATIHTVTKGDIPNGTVVFSKGKITAVGAHVPTAGATIVNGAGKHVYPGMIEALSVIGITEVNQGANGTVDESETGTLNPNANPALAVNPESELLAVARTTGITHANTSPQGGLISGTSALTRLDGWTYEDMNAVRHVALQVHWPRFGRARGGRGGFAFAQAGSEDSTARDRDIKAIRQIFDDARAYQKAKAAGGARFKMDTKLEALLPVIDGRIPVIIHADEPRAIRSAVAWAQEEGVRPIIAGAGDIWRAGSFLKETNVPVIVAGVLSLPNKESDPYDSAYTIAARLHEAGVKFCISDSGTGAEPDRARELPFHAGMGASFGLPKEEALKSVTLYPAQILGVGDNLGSIEVGKSASLILTSGDPLEIRTRIIAEYIDGRRVNLEDNKQFRLYQKYMKRPRATN
jgi:imidazolonepropionase-like amidohydrolase